jgi:U3 small nucleolar RNA-associated protein 14
MGDNRPAVCIAVKTKQIDMRTAEEKAHPLDSNDDKEPQTVCFAWANSGGAGLSAAESAPTVKANRNGNPAVCYERRDEND